MNLIWFVVFSALMGTSLGLFEGRRGKKLSWSSIFDKVTMGQGGSLIDLNETQVQHWTKKIPRDVQALCCDQEFKKSIEDRVRLLPDLPLRQGKVGQAFADSLRNCNCEMGKSSDKRPIVKGECPHMARNGTQAMEFINVDRSSNYCHSFVKVITSWPNAESICRQNGGHLASFHSDEELQAVTSLSDKSVSFTAWIGLYTRMDGQLKWTDESPVDYTNGISNGGLDEGHCAAMDLFHLNWFPHRCIFSVGTNFFCAVPKSEQN